MLSCEIDRVDLDQAVTACEGVIRSRGFAQHMAINVAKLVAMREDDQLRESTCGSQELCQGLGVPRDLSRMDHDPRVQTRDARPEARQLLEVVLARAQKGQRRVERGLDPTRGDQESDAATAPQAPRLAKRRRR